MKQMIAHQHILRIKGVPFDHVRRILRDSSTRVALSKSLLYTEASNIMNFLPVLILYAC